MTENDELWLTSFEQLVQGMVKFMPPNLREEFTKQLQKNFSTIRRSLELKEEIITAYQESEQ